jgi:hypothetical protein
MMYKIRKKLIPDKGAFPRPSTSKRACLKPAAIWSKKKSQGRDGLDKLEP